MRGQTRDGKSRRRWLEEFKHGPATILVWLLAVGAVGLLFQRRIQGNEYIGIAVGKEYPLSSATDARVVTVVPELCEKVKAGDVVATLNSAALEAEMEMVRAEVDEAKALLEAERLTASREATAERSEWQVQMADLASREERYRADALAVHVEIESARIEAQRLALEVERTRALAERTIGSQEEFDNALALHNKMLKRIEENTALVAGIEENRRRAEERLDDWMKRIPPETSVETQIAPFRELIRAREREVEAFRAKIADLVLRSPADGYVSQALVNPGKAVAAAETILVVRETQVTQIVGYIPDSDPTVPREGDKARVARTNHPSASAEAVVLRVGTSMEMTPLRMWRDPARPEFGRCFVLALPEPMDITPGEKIRIRIEPQQ